MRHIWVIIKTNGQRRDVLQTEVYDINSNQWSNVKPLFEGSHVIILFLKYDPFFCNMIQFDCLGQSEAGAAVVNNKIYIIGGHNWRERKDVRTVACYDPIM